jgi:hypothetical protein
MKRGSVSLGPDQLGAWLSWLLQTGPLGLLAHGNRNRGEDFPFPRRWLTGRFWSVGGQWLVGVWLGSKPMVCGGGSLFGVLDGVGLISAGSR